MHRSWNETHRLLSRVILIANQKGGVGKSSIVAAIAGMVASPTRRVLIIDADPQGNVSRNDLGVDPGDKGKSLALALQYGQAFEPVRDVRPGLDIVPGGTLLAGVASMIASAGETGIDIAANLADTLADLADREKYVLILIDSGPGDASLLDILLGLSRYLLVPSCDDEASFDGVEMLAGRYLRARARGARIDLLGVVLFNINPRATVRNEEALRSLTDLLAGSGATSFTTTIRTDKATAIDLRRHHLTPAELVAESERQKRRRLTQLGQGLKIADENRMWSRDPSGLATDYQNLAREVLARVATQEGRHRAEDAAPGTITAHEAMSS
jgi:chromosome partitioning protein